jgi:peptidoglycan/LPS O-acetylase OafA/YrhL
LTASIHRSKNHYVPLDSIRGLAALCVVIHHFVISKPLSELLQNKAWVDCAFFVNSWLFVDLFFVLSGIVISLSYVQSDFGSFGFREYVTRRLARIYPMHIVTLLAFLVFRLARLSLVGVGLLHAVPPEMPVNNAYSFFVNVLLLQALGFVDYLSWNAPSWSISAEFYTYLVFGLVVIFAQKIKDAGVIYVLSAVLVSASLLIIVFVLHKESMDFHYDFGVVRCVFSFFLGVLAVRIVASVPAATSPLLQTVWQFGAAIAAITAVCIVGNFPAVGFVAPAIFAVLLGSLMAFPARMLPLLLSIRPLVWLGKRSYSIYMVHAFVLVLIEYFARGVGAPRFLALDGHLVSGAAASLLLTALVVAVLVVANFTFEYIESPGSRIVKRLLGRTVEKDGLSTAKAEAVGQ